MKQQQLRILILCTIPGFTLALIRTTVLAGHRPLVATDQRFSNDWLSIHGHPRLVLDGNALADCGPETLSQINEWIVRHHIDVVVPGDTRCTRLLARHGKHIENAKVFPLPSAELFDRLYDKWTFYRLLEDLGLPTPKTRLITSVQDATELDMQFPLLMKPTWGESGVGICRIDDRNELLHRIQQLASSESLPFLIQEYLPGRDIDLNIITSQGKLVYAVAQTRGSMGIQLSSNNRVIALGSEICRACSYDGVAHLDMRIDERNNLVNVIEMNPRFWGSLMFSTWLGMNFLQLGLGMLGFEPMEMPKCECDVLSEYLGFSRGNLSRWVSNGFRAPHDLTEAQKKAFDLQLRDSLPEIGSWLEKLISLRQNRTITTD